MKKRILPQKSEKKSIENVAKIQKLVVKIDEKCSDQEKQRMVSYIIGKVYDKICYIRSSEKHK